MLLGVPCSFSYCVKNHHLLNTYLLRTHYGSGAGDTEVNKTDKAPCSCPLGVRQTLSKSTFKGLPCSLFPTGTPLPHRLIPRRPMAPSQVRAGWPWAGDGSVTPTLCALSLQGTRIGCAESKVACGSCCPQPGWSPGPTGATGWRVTCCTWRRWVCRRRCRRGLWCYSCGPHRWAWCGSGSMWCVWGCECVSVCACIEVCICERV